MWRCVHGSGWGDEYGMDGLGDVRDDDWVDVVDDVDVIGTDVVVVDRTDADVDVDENEDEEGENDS